MKVHFVRERISPAGAIQRLYRLEQPAECEEGQYDHIMVSAVVALFSGPETLIFPCGDSFEPISWMEMSGSLRGTLSHNEALRAGGYEEETT